MYSKKFKKGLEFLENFNNKILTMLEELDKKDNLNVTQDFKKN